MITALESYIDLLEKTERKEDAKVFEKRLVDLKEEAIKDVDLPKN